MLDTTLSACRSVCKADPSITPDDLKHILAAMRNHGRPIELEKVEPRQDEIIRRDEFARRLGDRSLRFVDKLAAEGVIRKITLPGRKRSCGFLAKDVERLINEAGSE